MTSFNALLRWIALPVALLLVAGCQSTPSDRARADSVLFESYPPEVRENLLAGTIEVGYDKDMVRFALGEPDRARTRVTDKAGETVWIYARQRPRLSLGLGGARGGGRTTVGTGIGVSAGGATVEHMRVIFRDGAVHSIEETL